MAQNIKRMKSFYKIRRRKVPTHLELQNGNYGLFANTCSVFTSDQIQALKRTLKVIFRKNAKIWDLNSFKTSITKKAAGVRLGRGKGAIKY